MLQGNEVLTKGIGFFQKEFRVKLMQLATRAILNAPLIQRWDELLTEVLRCLEATQAQAGRRRSFVGSPNEDIEAANLFYAYIAIERFLLCPIPAQYSKEQQAIIKPLALEMTQTILPWFTELASVVQEHYEMIRDVVDYTKKRRGSMGAAAAAFRRFSISSKPVISAELRDYLGSWKAHFAAFGKSNITNYVDQYLARPAIPEDAYFPSADTRMPILYRRDVAAINAKKTINELVDSRADNPAEIYYALGEAIDLFVPTSIATCDEPRGKVDDLSCLHLLIRFYLDMLGSMLFIHVDIYASLISEQVEANVRVDGTRKLATSSASRHASASVPPLLTPRRAVPAPPSNAAAASAGPPSTPAPYSTTVCPSCTKPYVDPDGTRRMKLKCQICGKETCLGCQSSHACVSAHA